MNKSMSLASLLYSNGSLDKLILEMVCLSKEMQHLQLPPSFLLLFPRH
jgi:hypothetical protein